MGRPPRHPALIHALGARAAIRSDWDRVLEADLERAEVATRGYMLTADAPPRVTARSLFLRTEAYARRWASEELLDHWDEHPRTSWAAYECQVQDEHLRGHAWGEAIDIWEDQQWTTPDA